MKAKATTVRKKGSKHTKRSLHKTKYFARGHFYRIRGQKNPFKHGRSDTNLLTLEVVENKGDGACLFLSILQYLKYERYDPPPRSVMNVRLSIVKHVIQNWPDYVFGLPNLVEIQDEIEDLECISFENLDKCQALYRQYMSDPGTFGTHIELSAACRVYGFNCVLLTLEPDTSGRKLSISVLSGELKEDMATRTLFILFSGDLESGHFRFLKPVEKFPVYLPERYPVGDYKVETNGNNSVATLVKRKSTFTVPKYEYE